MRTSEVRSMLQRRMKAQQSFDRPKSSLGSVRIEDFYGDRSKYQAWQRVVRAQQQLYQLAESELSMLIYISCKKEARDVLDQLSIEEMVGKGGLKKVWHLLDEAYHETSEEHFERVEHEFNTYRRAPGQSIPSYLSQIKRLKAEYMREDPESRLSDRAWAQRLLVRASLSKRERLDCFFSAGGFYVSREIERALRHRCQKIHEEERRLPYPAKKPFRPSPSSSRSSTTASTSSTGISSRSGRFKKGHGSYLTAIEEQDVEEEIDEEDLEKDPEAYEAYLQEQMPEDEEEVEDEAEDEVSEEEAITAEELKEAWAAGWRAKDQVAEKRKGRNFRMSGGPKGSRKDQKGDARKAATTCSSCGQRGHWKGDPECPKVKSGEDKPFQPKMKPKGVHFVNNDSKVVRPTSTPTTHVSQVAKDTKGVTMHEVNFTFVVNDGPPKKEKRSEAAARIAPVPDVPCPRCDKPMNYKANFCSGCGSSMALQRMVDQDDKRSWSLLDYASDEEGQGQSASAGYQHVTPEHNPFARPKPLAAPKCHWCGGRHLYRDCPVRPRETPWPSDDMQAALEALPNMNKHEKKELMRRLRSEDTEQRPITPNVSTAVAPGRENTTLTPPSTELPKAVKAAQLERFRRALYEERTDRRGRLIPSEAAPSQNEEQRACPHPWNRLRWYANSSGHYARCRACDLKHVLYWHERHGSFVTSEQEFLPKAGLLAIADSGCRTAVGGAQWHARFQDALKQCGMKWLEVSESEWFKFGAGEPVKSTRAYIYPVGIHGIPSYLRMSEVGGDASDCPGLVGPSDMSRWKVVFKFGTKEVDAMGVTRPMVLTSTRHPGLDLLDFGASPNFETPNLKMLRQQLNDQPHMFAFIAEDPRHQSHDVYTSTSGSEDDTQDGQMSASVASDDESQGSQLWELVEDLESMNLPVRDQPHDNYETDATGSEFSSTSHEFGRTAESEDSSAGSEVENVDSDPVQNTFITQMGALCTMSKGVKRRARHHVKEIKEAMTSTSKPSVPRPIPRPEVLPPKRPYKVLEIFTWTMAITMVAATRGWIGQEPVTLPRWNLREAQDRAAAFQYLVREEPDLLVIAWPCAVWSPLQFLGPMSEERLSRLMERQQEDRDTFLTLVHDMTQFQRSRGRAHLGENPVPSRAWKEPLIQAAYDGEAYGRADMCCYGLRRPDTKQLLKKPTQLAGTPEIVGFCAKRCPGNHDHAHTLGSYKQNGKTHSIAEFAGGYTKSFATQVVIGAERFLDSWFPECCMVYAATSPEVREEAFMDADAEMPPEHLPASDAEMPSRHLPADSEQENEPNTKPSEDVNPEILKTVSKIHQRLGHPTRDALLRMLKLSGAPKETLDCAKQYRCPVCESKAPPDKPYLQKPRQRPAGFNVEVHVDLKYAKNVKEETFVALSMVCAGTNKHAAVLLKTRKPSYCAQKFIKHWISCFGRPSKIVMDQGGEFEKEWILMLEQFGIHSITTGSHAGWQHAFAERHGALLGITWHALIVDFRVESRRDMAIALASAVEAKNETVTRKGYSPNMLVFGKCINYPELLADEDFDQVTMAQSMDVDCEMAQRSKMRNHARQVLLRDDVQQKLRRALQRRPATQDYVFVPGQVIYFYIPNMKPRYRQDHGRWRGPAVVIMQESHQRYYVSWRGRCLLLAAPNMRLASQEESMAHEWVKEEMEKVSGQMAEENGKEFQDLSQSPQPAQPAFTTATCPTRSTSAKRRCQEDDAWNENSEEIDVSSQAQ